SINGELFLSDASLDLDNHADTTARHVILRPNDPLFNSHNVAVIENLSPAKIRYSYHAINPFDLNIFGGAAANGQNVYELLGAAPPMTTSLPLVGDNTIPTFDPPPPSAGSPRETCRSRSRTGITQSISTRAPPSGWKSSAMASGRPR